MAENVKEEPKEPTIVDMLTKIADNLGAPGEVPKTIVDQLERIANSVHNKA